MHLRKPDIIKNTNLYLNLYFKQCSKLETSCFFCFWFFFLVATTVVALQQRHHMDLLDASVSTYHLCVTSALWLLGVIRSSCGLNQLLTWSKLNQALFCWTNVCSVGNLAAASVSRETPCKPADNCWEKKPGAEMHGQCMRSLDTVPVVHAIFCGLHCSFSSS